MATRFHFRLQSLLKLRQALEEEAKRAFAKTLQERDKIEARLTALHQEHAATLEIRRTPVGETVDLHRLRHVERYLVLLEHRMLQAKEDLALAQEQVAQARTALTKAHQAHLILLRLKERRQEQHDLERLQEEIRELDEIAVLRHRFKPTRPSAALAREATL